MTTAKTPQLEHTVTLPYRLVLDFSALEMTGDQFLQFCADNRDLRMELSADKELIVMPPAGGITSGRNSDLTTDLTIWARQDGTGKTFDSSGGFTLPNGAVRAPDASWILLSRWETLTEAGATSVRPDLP